MGTDPDGIEPTLLFAYGTLGPDPNAPAVLDGWIADAVRGRLFDLGSYPILVSWDDPEAGWVQGHVRPVGSFELKRVLDPYEGVDEGLFARVALRTRSGRRVWTYVFPHPVPSEATGPISRWDGPRVAPGSSPDLAPDPDPFEGGR